MKHGACLLLAFTLCCTGTALQAATIAYTGTGAAAGTNTGNLNIGRQFSVTGSGITVLDLGVFDAGSDGLINAHTVTLFTINSGAGAANANVSPLAGGSLTVPNGTAGTLDTGFRFSSLATPLFLAPGNYSVVAYGLNAGGGDAFGNGGGLPTGGNVNDIRFDVFQFAPGVWRQAQGVQRRGPGCRLGLGGIPSGRRPQFPDHPAQFRALRHVEGDEVAVVQVAAPLGFPGLRVYGLSGSLIGGNSRDAGRDIVDAIRSKFL